MRLMGVLEACTRNHLAALAASLGWPDRHGAAKALLIADLHAHLGGCDRVCSALLNLGEEHREALRLLVAHGGSMRLASFEARFGPLRPYRPWRQDSIREPWREPVSTTEELLYAGKVFVNGHGGNRQAQRIVLPDEFARNVTGTATTLSVNGSPYDQASRSPESALAEHVDLSLDIAILLAYLSQHEVVPLHGRWLPPRHVRRLGRLLVPSEPRHDARSELQTERLRLAHFMAEKLGLLPAGGKTLVPGPAASGWLAGEDEPRMRDLWRAWCAIYTTDDRALHALARRYRLPGAATRRSRMSVRALLEALAASEPDHIWRLSELERRLPPPDVRHDVPLHEPSDDEPWLMSVLRTELCNLGAVRLLDAHGSDPRIAVAPLGRRLLAGNPVDSSEPLPDAPSPLLRVADRDFALRPTSRLVGLLALAPWTEWAETAGPAPCLQLTLASVRSALRDSPLHPDEAFTHLQYLLRHHLAVPPDEESLALLRTWLRAAPIVRIRSVPVAEQLYAPPDGASTTHSRPVNGDPAIAMRRLQELGVLVRDETSAPGGALDPGAAEWLLASATVCQRLAPFLGTIAAPPSTVMALRDQLDPAARDRAEKSARDLLDRLRAAIDGAPPSDRTTSVQSIAFPAPSPTVPHLAARIERAIEARVPLHLRYWTASRMEETERRVWPEALEWIGDHAYLHAWCELRHDERVFRLDRIRSLRRCERVRAA